MGRRCILETDQRFSHTLLLAPRPVTDKRYLKGVRTFVPFVYE